MNDEQHDDATTSGDGPGRPRISRRQAMGRLSAMATTGAVAWVVPEILLAKPAAGAALSAPISTAGSVGVSTSPSTSGDPVEGVSTAAGASHSTSLAFTGLNIQRDAEVGAALVVGGWAMQHWASRALKPVD